MTTNGMEDGQLGDTSGTCSIQLVHPAVGTRPEVKHTRAQQSSQVGLLLSSDGRRGRHFGSGVSGGIRIGEKAVRWEVCRRM